MTHCADCNKQLTKRHKIYTVNVNNNAGQLICKESICAKCADYGNRVNDRLEVSMLTLNDLLKTVRKLKLKVK